MSTRTPSTHSTVPPNHIFVLFGTNGDLAKRKIIPGLYHLSVAGLMPKKFRVIGCTRRGSAMTNEEFRKLSYDSVCEFGTNKPEGAKWEAFEATLSSVVAESDDSDDLVAAVTDAEAKIGGSVEKLFHLAIPPDAVTGIVEMLGSAGLNKDASIIFEKPFGVDLASARALDKTISVSFDESHVFRIDHFLGKESIDNILALRFANGLFEPIWNRNYISYVQIDVPEKLSIEGRGPFFDKIGTLRDMVVTHLFQVLGLIAMEQPISLSAKPMRDEVSKVFDSIRPLNPSWVVRGQFDGYHDEPGVAPDSQTETFVALRTEIVNTRWKGVPFYLRSGKCLADTRQVVTIGFEEPVMRMFPVDHDHDQRHGNELVADFADPGSIQTHFLAKRPGPEMRLGPAVMTFRYQDSFQTANNLEAYERLILEAMLGNQALFTRSDSIERIWEIAAPVLKDPPPVEPYAKGSWGPPSIDRIVAPNRWSLPR
jgi:glucose-6-phosphate 1-dehydrogenase